MFDYFNNELFVDDTVVFPSSGCFMEGVIEKHREFTSRRTGEVIRTEVFVRNASGYKKWKNTNDVILKPRNS